MNTNTRELFVVPEWAKAENLEQCIGLNEIWKLDGAAVEQKQGMHLRKRIAHALHCLASIIDEDAQAENSMGYARA